MRTSRLSIRRPGARGSAVVSRCAVGRAKKVEKTSQGEEGKWRRLPRYSASRSRLAAPPPCFPCGFSGVLAGVFMGRRQVSSARTRSMQKQRQGAVASPGLITSLSLALIFFLSLVLLFFFFSLFLSPPFPFVFLARHSTVTENERKFPCKRTTLASDMPKHSI